MTLFPYLMTLPQQSAADQQRLRSALAAVDSAVTSGDLAAITQAWQSVNQLTDTKPRDTTHRDVACLSTHIERQKREKRRRAEQAILRQAENLTF